MTIRGLRLLGAGAQNGITSFLGAGTVAEGNVIGVSDTGGDPGSTG